jgi:NAD(P)-dependent dehydrogenase (short-subunit alcohol dehydrogenase family)
MSSKKVWFITGAGRGMGVDFAKAALAAGHAVVASGRESNGVSRAVGASNDLLVDRQLAAIEFGTAYAASKFGLEGWMESLHAEVAPFGIATTLVNPGFFRTELLTEQSTNYAEPSIADYDERRAKQLEFWKAQNGRQSGDPAKLARALITIAGQEPPPRRFIAGADAVATADQVVAELKAQIEAYRDLSTSLSFD